MMIVVSTSAVQDTFVIEGIRQYQYRHDLHEDEYVAEHLERDRDYKSNADVRLAQLPYGAQQQ